MLRRSFNKNANVRMASCDPFVLKHSTCCADRTQRLKDARSEAAKEIEAYKAQKEQEFKAYEASVRTILSDQYEVPSKLILVFGSTQETHKVYRPP